MKTSKLLTLLLIPAVLLTGCGLFGEEPTPEPEPTPTVTGEPQPGSTEVPYSWTEEQLLAYSDTPEFANALTTLAQEVQFEDENAIFTYGQVVVATSTALKFVETALDNGYFLANWWETRDAYKPVGIEELTSFTTGKAKTDLETYAAQLRITNSKEEAVNWYRNIIVMPPSNPDYFVIETCDTSWDMNACRAEEPVITNVSATRAQISGVVTVKMDVHITPIFNQVVDGFPGVEPRTYSYTFTLDPVRVPEILTDEDRDGRGTDYLDAEFTAYYLISVIEGSLTVGAPYAW